MNISAAEVYITENFSLGQPGFVDCHGNVPDSISIKSPVPIEKMDNDNG